MQNLKEYGIGCSNYVLLNLKEGKISLDNSEPTGNKFSNYDRKQLGHNTNAKQKKVIK